MTTTVGTNTSYQLTIPELSETADIQTAIKLIAYGQSADPTNDADIESNSIAGYLKALLNGPTFTGTVVLPSTTSIGNVSSTELGYLDGVTSAIQTQFTGKASTTSPAITTSITTTSTSFALLNTNATTLNFAGAATTLNIGNTATAAQTVNMFTASIGASTYNFATGAVGNGTTKTLNIGTGAGTAGTTNINLGGNPSVSSSNINLNGTVTVNGTANVGKALLQTVTTSSGASTLTFSSIPQTYKSLEVLYTVTTAGVSGAAAYIQFSGDTSTNYSYALQIQNGSSQATTTAPAYRNGFDQLYFDTYLNLSNNTAIASFKIDNYASTAGSKIGRFDGYVDGTNDIVSGTFAWKNRTTAVTSITITFTGALTGQVVTAQLFGIN